MTLQAISPSDIPWHKSEAKKSQTRYFDDGKHKPMKPKELHGMRKEYQTFPLKMFWNHIYQEVDSQAKHAHCFAKKRQELHLWTLVS
jgi:hypothetical protein